MSEMEEIYSTGKVCFPKKDKCLRLSPGKYNIDITFK